MAFSVAGTVCVDLSEGSGVGGCGGVYVGTDVGNIATGVGARMDVQAANNMRPVIIAKKKYFILALSFGPRR
jgi:hypothetical protein